MAKNKNAGKPRNYALESGVYRFGKGSMYHKKAIYKFTKKVTAKTVAKNAPVFVEKQVGGAKNGGTRQVRAKKLANDVPTVDAVAAGTSKNFFADHKRKVRASLAPGNVAILLAGVHKGEATLHSDILSSFTLPLFSSCPIFHFLSSSSSTCVPGKRVIVLKQLGTGLLLITGPHKLNGCPMRRVNQRYLVATSANLDISAVAVPANIDDKYFARSVLDRLAWNRADGLPRPLLGPA